MRLTPRAPSDARRAHGSGEGRLRRLLVTVRVTVRLAVAALAGAARRGAPELPAVVPRRFRVPAVVVTGVCAAALLGLAVLYHGGSGPGRLDVTLTGALASRGGTRHLADVVIHVGDPVSVLVLAAVLAVVAGLGHHPRLALVAVVGPAATGAFTVTAKALVGRTLDGDLCLPSGHSAAVTSLAVVAVCLPLRRGRRSSAPIAAVALALALVTMVAAGMGVALVAAGAHYATDAVAGYCAGLAVTLVVALVVDGGLGGSVGSRRRGSRARA